MQTVRHRIFLAEVMQLDVTGAYARIDISPACQTPKSLLEGSKADRLPLLSYEA